MKINISARENLTERKLNDIRAEHWPKIVNEYIVSEDQYRTIAGFEGNSIRYTKELTLVYDFACGSCRIVKK